MNKVQLIGNVGNDPDVKEFDGKKVATFSIATTEKGYTAQNGTVIPDRTDWHNIVVWGGLVKVIENFVKKGSQLYVEGKLRTRTWEKEGQKHYSTEIHVDQLELLGKPPVGSDK